jgi:hypothetical protein
MIPEYIYVTLIDVLGYKYRLERDKNSGLYEFKDDLSEALSVLNAVNTSVYNVQAISDTIIITCDRHDRFVEYVSLVKKVFVSFLRRGLFVRGGIAYSKHFQNGNITYSHAVARAYEVEKSLALYPRIVVDQNVVSMYESSDVLPPIRGRGLFVEHNGVVFLHIIDNENWHDVYKYSKDIYENDKEFILQKEDAFLKHKWFEDYLFSFVDAGVDVDRYVKRMMLF